MNCSSCERRDFASSLRCQWCGTSLQAGVPLLVPGMAPSATLSAPDAPALPGQRPPLPVGMPPLPAANAFADSSTLNESAPLALPAENDSDKAPKPGLKKVLGPILGVLVVFGGKLKFLLGALKFSKIGGTLVSMLVSVGFYAALFGWKFAVGFVLSIFVHEMGHVIALKRRGIPILGMYFIPFLGAAVSFKKRPANPAVDAEISWAGPFAGLLCGLFCAAVFLATGNIFWAALAHVTFLLNLINLAPSVPLDGGHIVKAINPKFSLVGSVIGVALGLYLHSSLLVIICALGAFSAFGAWRGEDDDFEKPVVPASTKLKITAAYLGLLLVLGSAMAYSTQVLHEDRTRRQGLPSDSELSARLSAQENPSR